MAVTIPRNATLIRRVTLTTPTRDTTVVRWYTSSLARTARTEWVQQEDRDPHGFLTAAVTRQFSGPTLANAAQTFHALEAAAVQAGMTVFARYPFQPAQVTA